MKICAITVPRSRSNWLTSTLSSYYNVPNNFEPYRSQIAKPHDPDAISNITESVSAPCVIKIEVTQFIDRQSYIASKLADPSWFKLDTFDKIYTSERLNVVDVVCSHLVASINDKWLVRPDDPAPLFEPMEFNPLDKRALHSMHWSLVDIEVMKYVQQWMTEHSIDYTPLYYETMLDYAKDHLGDSQQSMWAETGYDYSKLFTNYDQIAEHIETHRRRFPKLFTDWQS